LVDYSPTLSDAGALLYLATDPAVDLRAVTLAGTGESRCAAAVPTTRALLASAGRDDVPIACGRADPVGPGHPWPDAWRTAADNLLDPLELDPSASAGPSAGSAAGSAVELLADTAATGDGLVIVALGPLTNLAEAVVAHPEIVGSVEMAYTMGGAFGVPGNAPGGAAEWNYYADPTAVDRVVRSGLALTIVPLDATDSVPADYGMYSQMSPGVLRDLWSAAEPWRTGFFLWDELTAALAVEPALAPVGPMRIEVITEGTEAGRTVSSVDGAEVLVAGRAARRAVEAELLAGLAGR
jgi:inosine-uridine nucleoside N-ribohydrolase